MTPSQTWLRSYDPKKYDFIRALKEQGFVHWQQNKNHYAVGDIIFLYASSPVQQIVARLEVVGVNIQYRIGMDDDDKFYLKKNDFEKEPICIKVVPLEFNAQRHPTYCDLLDMGIKNVRSASRLDGSRVSIIMDMYSTER